MDEDVDAASLYGITFNPTLSPATNTHVVPRGADS